MNVVLLPTETINRELDYQLFLAVHLAARGAITFVGRADAVYTVGRYAKNGILIGKAFEPFFPENDLTLYEGLKKRGFVVLHLDEEGAIFPGMEADWRATLARRLDVRKIARDDVICTWGEYQREFYVAAGASDVRITGHPRFDLYNESYRAYFAPKMNELRGRYGDYVLVNTNLSSANNGLGLEYTFTKRFLYDTNDPKKRWEALRFYTHTSRILLNFVELVHALSDCFPSLGIIIRPHPSESHEYYRIVTTGLPNTHVIHEGSVAPWILASKALVHDGCTTGVEAWLSCVPVINYKSVADDRYDLFLPNAFGTQCSTSEEVLSLVRAVVADSPPDQRRPPRALESSLMINFLEPSFPRLLAVVDDVLSRIPPSTYDRGRHELHARVADGVDGAMSRARQFSPKRRVTSSYARQKFYGMRAAAVGERLARASQLLKIPIRWKLCSDALVCIQPA